MRIVIAIGSRANWGSLRYVARALRHRGATVLVVTFASATVERYGAIEAQIAADGVDVTERVSCLLDSSRGDMARTAGLGAIEWAGVVERQRPDAVVVVGDRYEVLGAATAASYAQVPLWHTMGGERSGNIDDRVRWSITALADEHCVATFAAGFAVSSMLQARLGQLAAGRAVHVVGCPRVDAAREALRGIEARGDGRYIVVSQHPVTTEAEDSERQALIVLHAAAAAARTRGLGLRVIWPNADFGTGGTHRAVRQWLATPEAESLEVRTYRAMPQDEYMRALAACAAFVGNSSSGIRECAWIGTPVVNVGRRQLDREHASNVAHDPGADVTALAVAVAAQVDHGPYQSSELYGRGDAGEQIAERMMRG